MQAAFHRDRRPCQSGEGLLRRIGGRWRAVHTLCIGLASFCFQPGVALVGAGSQLDADTVIVRADEAWEDDSQRALHFRGGVDVHASDWAITADSASLYGDLEDPHLVVGEGMPARLKLFRVGDEDGIEAEGRHIEYWPTEDVIRITNQAVLVIGRRTLRGNFVQYEVQTKRFTAGGGERVRVQSLPDL